MRKYKDVVFRYALLGWCVAVLMSCQQTAPRTDQRNGTYVAEDSRGTKVALKHPARRVVVLFEPMVDELYMLQAGEAIVGIPEQVYQHASSYRFLSKLDERIARKEIATPTYGGRANNVESVIGLRPDLAIVYEQDKETITQLEGLNIPVFAVSSKNKQRIYSELRGVATLLGKEQRAAELISYVEEQLKKMDRPTHGVRKKVYYAWSKGRVLSTSGKGSLMDLSIEAAGAENACPLEMEAPNIGAEQLYSWNPDIIVLWNSSLNDVYDLKELAALPAVKNKEVYVLTPTFNFDPHTIKFMLFAKQLRHWCYPEESAEELEKEIQEALDTLYGNTKGEA
ncbi:ABC transporter substrate-binding protein [Sphingobacterium sp. SGR-19]|uniref:ABC transporter substrate-binding protein n=1 Tax=Sphingobacterium sp. SGR-19 TaxID=2710886 RepID=UPI0013EB8B1C|nr:ABC transporter substrate-binding protein [Sphingobacterium sp. SGR-19]NGM63989.1 ABC transporter substrate-binding protein [Sphingobacterium sp. SGR-19]